MKRDHLTRLRQKVISYLASFLMVISLFPTNTVLAQEEYTYEPVAVANAQADSVENSGQENGGLAQHAIDGNLSTVWHTLWSSDGQKQMPHWISYELVEPTTIGRIEYWGKPGQNGVGNGVFKSIDIYVSQDKTTNPAGDAGWTLAGFFPNITYSATSGTTENRYAIFDFAPVQAAKVKIVVNHSYSSGSGSEPEDMYANALEIKTYKATAVEPEPEPEPSDTLPISVVIDGKSYEGASIQEIVENNGISTTSVKSFSIVGGNVEASDFAYLNNSGTFRFRDITSLTIDLTKAKMYNENGEVTTALPGGKLGTMKRLKELHLPGVTEIGYSNFNQAGNYSGIEVLDIPNVTVIGNRAFQSGKFATSLKNLDLSGVQVIDDQAFDCNNSFKTINLSSIVTLGDEVFDAEVSSLTLPATLTSIGHNAVIISEGGKVTFE